MFLYTSYFKNDYTKLQFVLYMRFVQVCIYTKNFTTRIKEMPCKHVNVLVTNKRKEPSWIQQFNKKENEIIS